MAGVSTIAPSSAIAPQPSPWHTPVPYLFGGLAAMMGLISFALLVLACSYWKLSGNFDHDNNDRDVESGNADSDCTVSPRGLDSTSRSDVHEKCLVIMAGEDKPTFLATPSSSRTTSFGSSSWRSSLTVLTESGLSSEVEMIDEMK
ncbi:hypothetical protein QVD17_26252 [Tagetes erecta]|uniref:Uncharacterized protein n=1 Tax=Tagetes erecta TaxID=13708 RepID=A0AAD8KCH8_TARER|nr:hypothetical protein QVD17_26252 [Tagetes erecta]